MVCLVWLTLPLMMLVQRAGKVEPSFGASLGLAADVSQVTLQPDGKLLIASYFNRALPNSTDGTVRTLSLQPGGSAMIVDSDFDSVDGAVRSHVARPNVDGVTRGGAARLNADGSPGT